MKLHGGIKHVYFVGIGGIGMSALARYFHLGGLAVAGYDRTPSVITDALQNEGIQVVFSDDVNLIPPTFLDPGSTLVVYTPAVETSQKQLVFFRAANFEVLKRSTLLGKVSVGSIALCVAGTHGKTTISTMAAHLFVNSKMGCSAFLGGISKNFGTNFIHDVNSPFVMLEADEFDRSFLALSPSTALVSSVDADHLDIYQNHESLLEAFLDFGQKIVEGGNLIVKKGLPIKWNLNNGVKIYSYSLNEKADFYASSIRVSGKTYKFNLVTPGGIVEDLQTGIPGLINIDNAVGACAIALLNGVTPDEIKLSLPLFSGISRRFEVHVDTPELVYIDDYAHHPAEITATLSSIRTLYPNHYLLGIFQPHLFSRTRDFAAGFSKSLNNLDELLLLDIYPARELPIDGITSRVILDGVKNIPARICSKTEIINLLHFKQAMVVVTMGAGDIDREVATVKEKLLSLINRV